jgi:hypothetical protein
LKTAWDSFLDSQLPSAGIVACAISQPGCALISRRAGDTLSQTQLERLLDCVAQAAARLDQHGCEARRLTWTFDHALLLIACRLDGARLVVVSENVAGQPPNEGARRLVKAFQEQPAS